MTYVLDTNAVSALMRGHPEVIAHLSRCQKPDVQVPEPVWSEIAYGIERLPQSRRRNALRERHDLLRGELARCLWTEAVSKHFGLIKAQLERRGDRIEDFDVAIAAHATAAGAVLVTADMGHMPRVMDLVVEDWTRAAPTAPSATTPRPRKA